MTPSNFNWFLHTMLFYHTRYVINQQNPKASNEDEDGDEDNENMEDDRDINSDI